MPAMPSDASPAQSPASRRRHDVDWLRVIALLLLILYHVAVSFQDRAYKIGFPQHPSSLPELWLPMTIFNIWRIPILFVISGLGVRFAMQRRDGKALMRDRALRIGLPLVFGAFTINALLPYFARSYYGLETSYEPTTAHLWFLLNILVYFVLFNPLLWHLKNNPDNALLRLPRRVLRYRLGFFIFALPYMLLPIVTGVDAHGFVRYDETLHGWVLGGFCFLGGFIFVSLGDRFWRALAGARFIALGLALLLYALRFMLAFESPAALAALESFSWITALMAFAARYLNRSSRLLRYLSGAVYPVYILHLPLQFALAYAIFPQVKSAELSLALLLAGTYLLSFAGYEILRRIKWLRPCFGMKFHTAKHIS